jgi:glycosyltransferase involved in cell wall biosynthesis
VAEETRRLLALGERPVEILPNVVDTAQFRPIPEIAEEEGLIAFVGTVCRKKGIAELLDAMPRIASAVPSARLVVIGRDTRDPETGGSYREVLVRGLPAGMRDRVRFAGAVPHDELPRALAAAQLCAYPSYMEAMPVAWLEGMAMGKAVLASRTGPGPELIEHGVSGWLCDPRDPAAIAEGIIGLLRDAALRERLGAAARARVEACFSVDAVVARTEAFYRQCAAGR